MNVIPFIHEGLGNSSYLVQISQKSALLVDPDRSIDRYLRELEARGLRLAAVLETHLHADFVTGSRELLALAGVEPYASSTGGVLFPHRGVAAGDALTVEGNRVRVIASPGHTPEHVSYVLESPGAEPAALFSGGSLIVGGAARTDLVAPELTEELTRAQYRTIMRAFAELANETLLYPTHGGGSFCSTGAGGDRTSTLGAERATNPLMQFTDEDEFAEWFPTTFPAAPDYFFKMRPINQAGPRLRSEIAGAPALDAEEFRHASESGVVIDTRPIADYHRAHIPGSISIAFRPAYGTWLGWLVEIGAPLFFVLGDEPLERVIEESQLVGQENFGAVLAGGIRAWEQAGLPLRETRSVPLSEAHALLKNGATALDVREPSEFAAAHLDQAVNLPLGSITKSLNVIPQKDPIIAYCGHGERSTSAISLLERQGIDAANLEGGFHA